MKIEKSSDNPVAIVKDVKDPSDTHKYSYNNVITAVNESLNKRGIQMGYKHGFNQYVLNMIIEFYSVKQIPKFAYEHIIGNQHSFTYFQQFVEFIVREIRKGPQHFVESLKKSVKK